ncbi:TPA: hypothetical protein N0F65_012100 [Lagenidium giganteum]|uniref:Uncharacterized protein n=1 Tax=Lagenidium giganteum TaxID=4803 RepID=A0AAV2YUK8_9STRA|nr:TPA: hypothetical protein N0F65_012100 [Lagenidium giganteum]
MGNQIASLSTFCVPANAFDLDETGDLESGRKIIHCRHELVAAATSSNMTTYLATPMARLDRMTSAFQRYKASVTTALINAAESIVSATMAAEIMFEDEESMMNDEFEEFQVVFERSFQKRDPAPEFIVPANTVVVKICDHDGRRHTLKKIAEDREDCESCTTEATDSLSEEECKSMLFEDSESDGEEDEDEDDQEDDGPVEEEEDNCKHEYNEINESVHQHPLVDFLASDEDENCETKAERLLRLASSCSDFTLHLENYLCTCGECPQYKTIEQEVAWSAFARHSRDFKRSVVRILQAFSTYNEVLPFERQMIEDAGECLNLWNGDESRAFTSFALMYDEIPHLCGNFDSDFEPNCCDW